MLSTKVWNEIFSLIILQALVFHFVFAVCCIVGAGYWAKWANDNDGAFKFFFEKRWNYLVVAVVSACLCMSCRIKVQNAIFFGFSIWSQGRLSTNSFLFILFCFVSFCFVLFCFVLFYFVLFCFTFFCFILFCLNVVLFCVILSYFIPSLRN